MALTLPGHNEPNDSTLAVHVAAVHVVAVR